jgi:D-arginine dehydrogenase
MGATFDVIIIGGGIAGASLAYFLAERGVTDVLLLEREEQPGHHATGRSAATLAELDPVPAVQQLKALGARFLREPPPGFAAQPLLRASGVLGLLDAPLWDLIGEAAPSVREAGIRVELLSRAETIERLPALAGTFSGAVWLPDSGRIDVHELLSGYLRHARARGLTQRCGMTVEGVRVEGGRCTGVRTTAGELRARWVVDAAGAWAGSLARTAGATPIALVPHRRTIVTFDIADQPGLADWPMVQSFAEQLYFAPESGGMLASPMDEDPVEPCDARPSELRIAEAMERLGRVAPRLVPRAIRRAWAGLRTFAPDRIPVVGEDCRLSGFFWLAGQGGSGIETSPALGAIAADLLVDGATRRFDAGALAPARFS